MTSDEAAKLSARLIDAFPQTPMRDQTPSLLEWFLRDLTFADTTHVVDEIIATSTEFPAFGIIRNRVTEKANPLPTALQAWASISGHDLPVHPFTKRVVSLFGGTWSILNAEKPSIARAQFLKAYDEMRDEELRRMNVANLGAEAA